MPKYNAIEGGAVETRYMTESANQGNPYCCLYKRILVLPNRPAPSGFRLHEIMDYFQSGGLNSQTISKSRLKRQRKKTVNTAISVQASHVSSRILKQNTKKALPRNLQADQALLSKAFSKPHEHEHEESPVDCKKSEACTLDTQLQTSTKRPNNLAKKERDVQSSGKPSIEPKMTSESIPFVGPPPPSTVPPSPRALRTARNLQKHSDAKSSLVSVMRAKVQHAALSIFSENQSKLHAAQILQSLAESNEGTIALVRTKGLIGALFKICESVCKEMKREPGLTELCLNTLTGVCGASMRMQSRFDFQGFLHSTLVCTLCLQKEEELAPRVDRHSNQGKARAAKVLAAASKALKTLSEYYISEQKDMFVKEGGLTMLLVLSMSESRNVSKSAHRAICAYTQDDLLALQLPSFVLNSSSPLLTVGGKPSSDVEKITKTALSALALELNKRNKRKQQEQANAKMRHHRIMETNSPLSLQKRASKLEKWIENRNLELDSKRKSWRKRAEAKMQEDKKINMLKRQQQKEERRLRELAAEEYRARLLQKHKLEKARRQESLEQAQKAAITEAKIKERLNEEKMKLWLARKRKEAHDEKVLFSDSRQMSNALKRGKESHNLRGMQVTGSAIK